jgi:TonB family protein
MADSKALFTERFDTARAALKNGDEPAAAESLHWAIVAARSDPALRLELASGLFHLGKLSRKFGRAGEAEAEKLLTESLAVTEGIFGEEHAALVPPLNELARLYVQRSQHARAELPLQRLLAIARSKGEQHADVASALAALAVVKRKLGDDASAEALYRDALRIRENVLEANSMVTVTTLEQLSETCVARGNLAEALGLLRRALLTREVVMGPGHATVQAIRSRVDELELQVAIATDAAARAAREPLPTPAFITRTPRTPTDVRERVKTPAVSVAVAASLMASPLLTPHTAHVAIPVTANALGATSVIGVELYTADVEVAPAMPADLETSDIQDRTHASESVRKPRTILYASGALAATAIAIVVMMLSHASGSTGTGVNANPGKRIVAQNTAPAVTTIAAGGAATATTRADSSHAAIPTSGPVRATQPETPVAGRETRDIRMPRVEIDVKIPSVAAPNVDSIVRAATDRSRSVDARPVETPVVTPVKTADLEVPPTPPKLIGTPPAPRFPNALRSTRQEGEVLVQVKVDALGRVDVGSMIVVQSDHEQFTAAVREVLPRYLFDPARTPAPESKPVAAWVSIPFRFRTQKK